MNYVELVNRSVLFIEDNINTKLTLNDLSREFNISQAHFNRVFKFLTGFSLKKYITSRKLFSSLNHIKKSNESIINIAMDFGFDYPEVFSRAFKKQFGISPKEYRKSENEIIIPDKAEAITRNIVNCNGGLTLKSEYTYLDELVIFGVRTETNINREGFIQELKSIDKRNYTKSSIIKGLKKDDYYHVISCLGDGENFELFYGYSAESDFNSGDVFDKKYIEKSWYISFNYSGEITRIYNTLRSDIEKSFKLKKIPLRVTGVGIILIFNPGSTNKINVLVPIERE